MCLFAKKIDRKDQEGRMSNLETRKKKLSHLSSHHIITTIQPPFKTNHKTYLFSPIDVCLKY